MAEESRTSDLAELVRQANEAYNRRELESLLSLHSPDVVYRPIPTFTDSQERRGRDEVRRFYEEFLESWADDFVSNLDTVRVYGEAAIARIVFTGHARASGVEISARMFKVFFFQEGLVARIEDFTDREEAVRAAEERG